MRRIGCTLALALTVACGHGEHPAGPVSEPPGAGARAGEPCLLEFAPIEESRLPLAVAVRAGETLLRTGPLQQWRVSLPAAVGSGPVWIDALPADVSPAFYPLRVATRPGLIRLPLVPRVTLPGTIYLELLDLLQEFLAPFEGSRVRRWDHRPLTVSLPPGQWPVDYADACRQAIEAWNQALGGTWLVPVEPELEADVRCEIAPSDRLAYTRLLETDESGRPTSMLLHLSPSWSAGAERYVRRAYLHELGHALGLWGHSRDLQHVINGRAVIRDELHPDEIRAMRWLWSLPPDFDLVQLRRPARAGPGSGRVIVTGCSGAMERGIAAIHPW